MSEGTDTEVIETRITPEESALAKVKDINVAGTLAHVMPVEKLDSALKVGVVSESFAKRAGLDFKTNWKDYSNAREVGVAELNAGGPNEFKNLFELVREIGIMYASRAAVLILNNNVLKEAQENEKWPTEKKVRLRFSPKYIEGIAVGGSMKPFMGYMPDRRRLTSLTKDKERLSSLKEKALAAQREIFGDNVEKYVPIYDIDGNLLWPESKSAKEIAN